MNDYRVQPHFSLLLVCALLLGCGGGGGGGSINSGTTVLTGPNDDMTCGAATLSDNPVPSQEPGLLERPDNLTCTAPPRPANDSGIVLTELLSWGSPSRERPVGMFQIPGAENRWMAISQYGVVSEINSSYGWAVTGTILDLTDIVTRTFQGDPAEFGALGLALHPEFESVPIVYLTYTVQTAPDAYEVRLSSFRSDDGGHTLVRSSEQLLLTLPLVKGIHVSGHLTFGPDGYLYLGVGDGGVPDRAQDPFELYGKILRLAVDDGDNYWIPADNPFADGGGAPEVWALGLRNPWQFSFDTLTGDLWAGDVGLNDWEEVDLIKKGAKYGWPYFEGPQCRVGSCPAKGFEAPFATYSHQGGSAAIVGGFVYRGSRIPELQGLYIFMDLVQGQVWTLDIDGNGQAAPETILEPDESWANFAMAQDNDGELYALHRDTLRRIEPAENSSPAEQFPASLSATGCMNADDPRLPGPALIPYAVNSELWSDGAVKQRWMALPNGSHIDIDDSGDWEMPRGSVLVKHFALNERLVETRLFVRHEDGGWGGYSYEWNEAQTEAYLLAGAKSRKVVDVFWQYPSRNQCMQCHTEAAGGSLGLETAQLNRATVYPTGIRANQLTTLSHIGVLPPIEGDADRLVSPWDASADINERARSYLHANCSFCHRPDGPGQGPEDFRFHLANRDIGAVEEPPTQGDLKIADARLIAPGEPDRSLLLHRMEVLFRGRMPPLGTAVVHEEAVELIRCWIEDPAHFD
jgi:uncharacterized repeat protein (TIGR03806 family)